MKITWTAEAERTLRRVPFFVRHRVRKKVEEEVAAAGRERVSLADLEASKRRHLETLSQAPKGYTVEACFGSSGCDNAVVASAELVLRLEELLEKADLLRFLRSELGERLKLHHQVRVTVADCPNCCSQPQIKDIGIIGQAKVTGKTEECTGCGECETVCEESAIQLKDGLLVGIDEEPCVQCGACARVCPTGALAKTTGNYKVLVGGKLGRHPQLARELASNLDSQQVLDLVERIITFYKSNSAGGERFGALINRIGWGEFSAAVL